MSPKRRIEKKPSAKTKIRKIDKALLSSQFSQSQTLSQSRNLHQPQTPKRRSKTAHSLVKPHQSIFSPKKVETPKRKNKKSKPTVVIPSEEEEEEEEGDDNNDSDNSNHSIIEIDSSDDETAEKDDSNETTVKPLTTYTVPLNTRKWVPLPQQVHYELSTLLRLLSPPSLDEMNNNVYKEFLESDIIAPLSDKFSTIYLPPVHKYLPKKVTRENGSGDFNLSLLHQDQKRLLSSYDVNTKQLDTLALQLQKEKEMIATEKKYLQQLRDKVCRWKENKEKRLQQMKNNLGDSFKDINESLDIRNSGIDGVDDLDMVEDSSDKSDIDGDMSDDSSNDDDDDHDENNRVISLLTSLKKSLQDVEASQESDRKFQTSLRQLQNLLEK